MKANKGKIQEINVSLKAIEELKIDIATDESEWREKAIAYLESHRGGHKDSLEYLESLSNDELERTLHKLSSRYSKQMWAFIAIAVLAFITFVVWFVYKVSL